MVHGMELFPRRRRKIPGNREENEKPSFYLDDGRTRPETYVSDMKHVIDLWTIEETCDWLRMKRPVVKKMARDGRIPAHKVGKFWRFNEVELLEWLNQK